MPRPPRNASAAGLESLASAYQEPDNEDQHQQAADPASDSRTAPVIATAAAKKNQQNQNK
jgi:Na+-transporting methylmalonyl-CoA/oxaloacetate decarboxylase gamma subunit